MNDIIPYSYEQEQLAQAMLKTRGDLAKASRLPEVPMNVMELRRVVQADPAIRERYQQLLAEEMQEKGLHIAERILKMAELQEQAFGGYYEVTDPETGEVREEQHLQNPKMAIELSREISRLIEEGRGQNMSTRAAVLLANKEDAREILRAYLESK